MLKGFVTGSLAWFDDLSKNIYCPLNRGLIVKDDLTDILSHMCANSFFKPAVERTYF